MESYEDLLKKARSELPEDIGKGERFVVPKVVVDGVGAVEDPVPPLEELYHLSPDPFAVS